MKNCSIEPNIFTIEIAFSIDYSIYKCSQSSEDNFTIEDTKYCFKECLEDYFESPKNNPIILNIEDVSILAKFISFKL